MKKDKTKVERLSIKAARAATGLTQFDFCNKANEIVKEKRLIGIAKFRPERMSAYENRRLIPTMADIIAIETACSTLLQKRVVLEERRLRLLIEQDTKFSGGYSFRQEAKENKE